MEFGPIFRAMKKNKVAAGLLILEIAFTLTVALNALTIIRQQRAQMDRESGIDEANIVGVITRPYGSDLSTPESRAQLKDEDLQKISSLPGVLAVTSTSNFPLQGGGSSGRVKPLGADESQRVRSPWYSMDETMLDALGLELHSGRALTRDDMLTSNGAQPTNVLITKALADALFPDGDALGQKLDTGSADYPDTIVGIVKHMHTPYGGGPMEERIVFYPAFFGSYTRYLVRAEPGQLQAVRDQLESAFLATYPHRVIELRSLQEIKNGGYVINRIVIGALNAVVFLLYFVTGIGLLSMAWFSVTKRKKQIGIRRALGATRGQILRYFLVETTLITVLGCALGIVGAFALNLLLVKNMEMVRLSPLFALAGIFVLWLWALAASLWPAMTGSKVPPAVATRTV